MCIFFSQWEVCVADCGKNINSSFSAFDICEKILLKKLQAFDCFKVYLRDIFLCVWKI